MASRKVLKSDLLKLLPGYELSSLPAELVSLSETLFNRLETQYMVATEQPARSFVCAHIACERLANQLDLPERSTAKTPIHPSNYKSLYKRLWADADFRRIQDSGQTREERSRKVAHDLVQEVCSKLTSVPAAMLLAIVDRVLPYHESDELRPLIAACWLMTYQLLERSKTLSASAITRLSKELCITKSEIDREVKSLLILTQGGDFFDGLKTRNDSSAHADTTKRPMRVSQVRMSATAIDYNSAKCIEEYAAWKSDLITRYQSRSD